MEKTFIEKRLEFLNETLQFYSEDTSRRAIREDSTCCYRTADGKKCAIGRHIPNGLYNPDMEGSYTNNLKVQQVLSQNIKDLGEAFLSSVQALHDNCENWNFKVNGLTETGKGYVQYIKTCYCTIKQ